MKSRKKFLSLLLAISATLCVSVFSACDTDFLASLLKPSEVHTHVFVDGECECGEPDPDFEEPTNPETPSEPNKPSEPSKPTEPSNKVSEGLKYSLSSDGTYYSVSIGNCMDTDIVIPYIYNDLPVTAIGDFAFDFCDNLTSVTIPNFVTYIGEGAFYGCDSLTSVTFKNTNGWIAGDTSISSIDLANPETAATYLRNKYCSYTWTRS